VIKIFLVLLSTISFCFAGEARKIDPVSENTLPNMPFDPVKQVKIAAVAVNPVGSAPVPATADQAEAFKAANRAKLAGRIREAAAQGAEIIVTPEFGVTGYPDIPGLTPEEDNFRSRDDIRPYVEAVPGPSSIYFGKLAAELKVYIHFSLATAMTPDSPYHDSVVVVNPKGDVVAVYSKIELFHIETNYLVPGDGPVTYDGPAGKTGLIICSDSYSPRALNPYRGQVDLLTLSSSWAESNTGMAQFQQTARQMGTYFVAANQMYFPDSGVVNPDGTTQTHIRQSEVTAYGYLPRKQFLGIFP